MSSQWFYRKGPQRFGPVSGAEIKKLAAAGELVESDLVRGVGMTEWVPASKIKGLFVTKTATPEISEPKKQAAPPPPPKVVEKTVPKTPVAKPPAPVVDANDPFAFAFGEATSSADPFAGALDQLVALEKQGAAIYREPIVVTETDSVAKSRQETDEPAELGTVGKVAFFAVPFVLLSFLAFACTMVYAFIFLFMMGFPKVTALLFCFSISVGLSKMTGLFAGNCLLKAHGKNEVLSLGYGGLLGVFALYIYMASFTWMLLTFNPYKGHFDDEHFDDAEGNVQEVWVAPKEEEQERPQLVLFQEDKDTFEAVDEFRAQLKEQDRIQQRREAGFLGATSGMSVSFFACFQPYWTFFTFPLIWWFWLIHGFLLVTGMAHATWTANLGHDPTRGGL
jgi:hypothetical protein